MVRVRNYRGVDYTTEPAYGRWKWTSFLIGGGPRHGFAETEDEAARGGREAIDAILGPPITEKTKLTSPLGIAAS